MKTIREPEREVPVAREVDVLVAGAGVGGTLAALTAAKGGMKVLLVDRFGVLGGNFGAAGIIIGGKPGIHPEGDEFYRDSPAVFEEFVSRAEALLRSEGFEWTTAADVGARLPLVALVYSRVAADMAAELGVELMLSAYAGAPIMEGNTVKGLFVETKSGRVAVTARVTIDATGDASVAARAGAPMRSAETVDEMVSPNMPQWTRNPRYPTYNESGVCYLMYGVDLTRFKEWADAPNPPQLSEADAAWREAKRPLTYNPWRSDGWPDRMIPILRQGWESGEFKVTREVRPGLVVDFPRAFTQIDALLAHGRTNIYGQYDTGSWEDVSIVETAMRAHVQDGVRFFGKHVPGFERATLVAMSAFMGARGGPHIDGEFVLTPQDSFGGLDHPDTLYRCYIETMRKGNPAGHDVPYGMMLPKGVDGLLVAGRGASWLRRGHDPSFRSRRNMMRFGIAAGYAAVQSVRDGVSPRRLDVRKLQQTLFRNGFGFGATQRLIDLGLQA